MFKKAKLYSLLAIIVASTVVSLFSFSQTVSAQATWAGDVAAGETMSALDYDGNGYRPRSQDALRPDDPVFKDNVPENVTAVYVYFTYTDNNSQADPTEARVIFFTDDPSTATSATFVQFDVTVDSSGIPHYENARNKSAITVDPTSQGDLTDEDLGVGDSKGEETPSSCEIKGIGWFVCPVVTFLGIITDSSYAILDRTLLKLEPMALPGGNSSGMELYDSWKVMRDFANIVFIIGFLIIVFSQITSIGISNYGVKRLLPKIIIAAILVNISYYICVVGVDLSNIIGNSLRSLFDSVSTKPSCDFCPFSFQATIDGNSNEVPVDSWQDLIYLVIGGAGLGVAVVGTGAIAWAALPVLLPMVVGAALAVFTVVVALTIRQALIVILVIISPLAFVALLLPNTEDYFKKWRSLFVAMLLVYPIISVVFGASALASRILMATGDFPVQIVGAGVSIIPLFITPIIMKVSGGLLNRIVGVVNDPSKGWVDSKRNALEEQGNIIRAQRKARGIERTGGFVSSTRGSRFLGGANSRRRRALAFGTSYGEKIRKDNLGAAESGVEGAYLGTEGGRDARNAAANAKISLQNAQINTDTIRISSPEGIDLQQETTRLEKEKHAAETEAQTAAISAIPHALEARAIQAETEKKAAEDNSTAAGLTIVAGTAAGQAALGEAQNAENRRRMAEDRSKTVGVQGEDKDLMVQAATSSETLARLQNEDKQLYEEIAAKGTTDLTYFDPATHGVSHTAANDARASRFDKKAVDSAVTNAGRQGEIEYSKEVKRDPSLASRAGGRVDPKGEQRAISRATTVENTAFNEAVKEEKNTMTTKTNPELETIRDDVGNSAERRAAATGMLAEKGGMSDIINTFNKLASDMSRAQLAGNTAEVEALASMQQQYMADVGNRLPASVTGPARGQMSIGQYTGGLDNEILESFRQGKYNGEMMAKLHPKEIQEIKDALSAAKISFSPGDLAKLTTLQTSIGTYRGVAPTLGKGIEPEREVPMDGIQRL